MTKCIATPVGEWLVDCEKLREELDFLREDLRLGERQIEQTWLERIKDQISEIANTFLAIKTSCLDELDRWDCSHLQELLASKLSRLNNETQAVISDILESKLANLNKHRYFILFAYGTVEQLEMLLRTVGRLSDLNPKIYFEDQCKPLVCEESIVIHSLTSIWSTTLDMMHNFQLPASKLFTNTNQDGTEDQESLIQSLDFSTTCLHHHRVFLMDLICTSWLQFNRLLNQEKLISQLPFLCACHTKQYFKTLELLSSHSTDLLSQLLPLILGPQSKPSMMTQSVRHYGVAPSKVCFASASREELAYFVVWHLYAVSRVISDKNRPLIKQCQAYLLKCANIAFDQFLPIPASQETPATGYQISPRQEERLSLLLLMLNGWCEKNGLKQSCLPVVALMFSFFDKHWNLFNQCYLDNSEFRVGDLTVFQLFTKIIDEIVPLYTVDGHAPSEPTVLTREEKQLKTIWDRIVERKEMPGCSLDAITSKKTSVSQ